MYDVAQCPSICPFMKPYEWIRFKPSRRKIVKKKGRNKQKGDRKRKRRK
jgi:hypothetical protein